MNKVGPFSNPHETYRYYSLPFCRVHEGASLASIFDDDASGANAPLPVARGGGDGTGTGSASSLLLGSVFEKGGGVAHGFVFGESVAGDRHTTSPYSLNFMDAVSWRQLCSVELQPKQLKALKSAIHDDYYFEMFVEDLPMWGYLGEVENEDLLLGEVVGSKTYLYPHLHFQLGVNPSDPRRVVSASVFTHGNRKVDITDTSVPVTVAFSYSAEWVVEEHLRYETRMSRYVDSSFLPRGFEIHWISIVNSLTLVLLLTTFLAVVIMRAVKNDFLKYMELDSRGGGGGEQGGESGGAGADDKDEESGWKLLHGDVFRPPDQLLLFAAALGAGAHLLASTFMLLTLAVVGVVSTVRRGGVLTGMLVCYNLLGFVGGGVAASHYKMLGGKNWVPNLVVTALLFPAPTFLAFAWSNTVAAAAGATSALPAFTVFLVGALFVAVGVPTTVVGGILARHYTSPFSPPCRTNKCKREIPQSGPAYASLPVQVLVGGFLPFSAIYVELHYIFAAVWGHKIYTLFGILYVAFALLVVVTACVSVTGVYFRLCGENYNWWWSSFLTGGGAGVFILAYSWFYYYQTEMEGLVQGSFFFGYMVVASWAFVLMLGSVGFVSSLEFVKYIYRRVKCD